MPSLILTVCFHNARPDTRSSELCVRSVVYSRAVVVSHEASSLDLNQEQMQCLRPETWLNDEVCPLVKDRQSQAVASRADYMF